MEAEAQNRAADGGRVVCVWPMFHPLTATKLKLTEFSFSVTFISSGGGGNALLITKLNCSISSWLI